MEYTKGMGWDKNTNTKIAGEGGPLRSGEEEKWSCPQGMGGEPGERWRGNDNQTTLEYAIRSQLKTTLSMFK